MGSSRYVVMTKSPLSKFVAEAYGGGFFPTTLKNTGYDGVIFRGKSNKPVYLEMIDGEITLKDASEYWGKGIFETHDKLIEKYGNKARTALIGPAGENKVRYAAIINDKNRAAARGGVGAVLGSKLVKGIVVKGNIKLRSDELFKDIRVKFRKGLMDEDQMNIKNTFGVYGTSGIVSPLSNMNLLPTKNFKYGEYSENDKISGKYMEKTQLLVGRDTCATCGTFCKRKIDGEYKGVKLTQDGSSLEYETLASFGSLLMVNEVKLVGLANQMCNDYGLDTISTGVSIAYAMEAKERGMADQLGIDLNWGDEDQIIEALEKISKREDYGDQLAEGVWRMSEKIGGQDFAMHTKGMELAMHEARGKVGLGLSYATSPRGGTHMEGLHDSMVARENASPDLGITEAIPTTEVKGKGKVLSILEDATSFTNSLIICAFDVAKTGKHYNLGLLQDLTSTAMGIDMNTKKMLEMGARIYNMWRMVAVREGLIKDDDDLPERLKKEPLQYGEVSSMISQDKLDLMLIEYYHARGWDNDGKPTVDTIKRLQLPSF